MLYVHGIVAVIISFLPTAHVLKTAKMRERITKAGAEPSGMSIAEFAAFLKSESAKWGKLVRDSGAKAE